MFLTVFLHMGNMILITDDKSCLKPSDGDISGVPQTCRNQKFKILNFIIKDVLSRIFDYGKHDNGVYSGLK